MTEDEARAIIRDQFGVSRETRLADFANLVGDEASRQNLVAPASLSALWTRHILDSAQLLAHAPSDGLWLDIGTGAGFPGMVIGLLRDQPTVLVEPRRRRAEFLEGAARALGADNIVVKLAKVEATAGTAAVISARAVASIPTLFSGASGWSRPETIWIFPRGRNGRAELADARKSWQGSFHVEQSLTSPDSVIVVATKVRPR